MTALPGQSSVAASAQATPPAPAAAARPAKQGFTAWPLWASAAGALGFAGTIVFDVRPDAETEAWLSGEDYSVTSADMLGLAVLPGRLGWTAGLLAMALLLVFAAVWWRRTQRFERSVGAKVVAFGAIATAATGLLGYGWKGALANYLGPEAGLYDEQGLFVYYMLTDFGAYFPWFGVLVSALAMAWMAFAERLVSRVLGVVSALFGLGLLALMLVSGVPGIPGTLIQGWLVIAGLWLAVGRSRITERDPA
ncbi:hypothetical protein [Leucobacter sp. GX0328]